MAKNFGNSAKKTSFLNSLPQDCISTSDVSKRSKFNFSYLDISQGGSSFSDLNTSDGNSKLTKLVDKLKEFSKYSLAHWNKTPIGKGKKGGQGKRQNVLEVYGDFPQNSAFTHPKHVPEDIRWARFRIDCDTRLAGFVLPDEYEGKKCSDDMYYDTNTFYVVFIDEEHQFYITK